MSELPYTAILEGAFSKFVKQYNQLQLNEYNGGTIVKGNSLIMDAANLLKTIRSHCVSLESLLADCVDFVKELEETDSRPANYDPLYVYKNKNGILSYPGKTYINTLIDTYEENRKKKKTPKPKNTLSLERVLIPDINHHMNIHVIDDISNIPPALFYHKQTNGIYIRLHNNNVFKIPFPSVVDSRKDYSRNQSIRCKYKTRDECDAQRSKMASIYNSNIRECNFAHKGEKIVKIGHQSRCPSAPSYGNTETLLSDIRLLTDGDAKSLLLYGLSDIFMASLWLEYAQIKNKAVYNLDVV